MFAILAMGAAIAVGESPEAAVAAAQPDLEPTVRVSPTTDLVDQQPVRVRASDFPHPFPGSSLLIIAQCTSDAVDPTGCGDLTNRQFATEDGSLVADYRVSRILQTQAFGTVDCAATPERCVIAVATDDLQAVVTVPISFDPTVPPLPPVDIDASLAPTSTVRGRSGVVTLRGTVTCTIPTPVTIVGFLGQDQAGGQVFGLVDAVVDCQGTTAWAVKVTSYIEGLDFAPGTAFVDVTVAVDRNGPRDVVVLDIPSHPLVPHRGLAPTSS